MPDSPEVAAEVSEHGDVFRVPAVHTGGNEGKSQLMHDLWRSLAVKHDAQFYVKAQVRAVASLLNAPLCVAEVSSIASSHVHHYLVERIGQFQNVCMSFDGCLSFQQVYSSCLQVMLDRFG
jgi:hypothetical protein